MSKRINRSMSLALLLLASGLGACGSSSQTDVAGQTLASLQPIPSNAPRCSQPAEGELYPPVDAVKLGFDQARLDAALQYGERLLSTSVRVYRYGCLAAQTPADRFSVYSPQFMASASKTVLALSLGRAATLGYLSVDEPIGKYLPEADAAHGALTIRQLLNQVSGL